MMDDLELHAVGLALLFSLPAFLASPDDIGRLVGYAFLAIAILIPQGRLVVKAMEYSGARRKRYLLLNESLVFAVGLLVIGVWGIEYLLGTRPVFIEYKAILG